MKTKTTQFRPGDLVNLKGFKTPVMVVEVTAVGPLERIHTKWYCHVGNCFREADFNPAVLVRAEPAKE